MTSVMQQSYAKNDQLIIIDPGWNDQVTTLNLPKVKFTYDITFPSNFSFNFNLKLYEDKISRFEYIAISDITGLAIAALVQVGDILLKVNDINMIETYEQSQNLKVASTDARSIKQKLALLNNLKSSSRVIRFLRCPDLRPFKVLLQLFLDDSKVSSKFLAQSSGDGSQINTLQVLYSDVAMYGTVKKLMQGQKVTWEIKSSSNAFNVSSGVGLTTASSAADAYRMVVSQEIGKSYQLENPQLSVCHEGVVKDPRGKWLVYVQISLPEIPVDTDGYYLYKVPAPSVTPATTSTNEAQAAAAVSKASAVTLTFPSRKRPRDSLASAAIVTADKDTIGKSVQIRCHYTAN